MSIINPLLCKFAISIIFFILSIARSSANLLLFSSKYILTLNKLGSNIFNNSNTSLELGIASPPLLICSTDTTVLIFNFLDENKILSHRLGSHQRYNS